MTKMASVIPLEFKPDLPLPLGGGDKVSLGPTPESPPSRARASAITPGIGKAAGFFFQPVGALAVNYIDIFQLPKHGRVRSWLSDALDELDEADAESEEEGLPACSRVAKDNAKQILGSLAEIEPLPPVVYPTEDQEIAIFFRRHKGGGTVLLLCDSVGGGACFSSIDGSNRRARYDDATELPDAFVKDQLVRLRKSVNAE